MTCAPRGMESTKSASSGRNARYPVLAVEWTTEPSGAPMRSSCAIAPRWVWKSLPGSRTTVCSRPLGSVSCTRSPATKAPATGGAPSCPPPLACSGRDPARGLSPSRAADFKTCPLLYRFRTIDRLPERRSLAAVRGTLVHSVLERLYDLPARERTPEAARELVAPAWEELRADPEVAELFAGGAAADDAPAGPSPEAPSPEAPSPEAPSPEAPSLDAWLASAGNLVETY